MSEKTDKEKITELTRRVDDLTKVLSAFTADIDDRHPDNSNSCYWWKKSFLEDLDVSNELKSKLGLMFDDDS